MIKIVDKDGKVLYIADDDGEIQIIVDKKKSLPKPPEDNAPQCIHDLIEEVRNCPRCTPKENK